VPLIDDRGRLFGTLNLIDAVVGLFVLFLVPLAYGAFLLFRVPAPTITSLQPATVAQRSAATVTVTGTNLRPFLRARIGGFEAPFLIQSPTSAELKLPPELPVGSHDLMLFDEANRVLLKPAAITVEVPATAASATQLELQAVGAFVNLSQATASIDATTKFSLLDGLAGAAHGIEVLAVRPPEPMTTRVKIGASVFVTASLPELRVPAIIRFTCPVVAGVCALGGTPLAPNATIVLAAASNNRATPSNPIRFTIDQLFPSGARAEFPSVVTARVRFAGGPELLQVMKAGDVDLNVTVSDVERLQVIGPNRAVLTALGGEPQTMTALSSSETVFRRSFQLQQPLLTFIGTVRVPVVFTPFGWTYKDRPVKVGAPFIFESISGGMTGWILVVK
jgi:hypothetical protein